MNINKISTLAKTALFYVKTMSCTIIIYAQKINNTSHFMLNML